MKEAIERGPEHSTVSDAAGVHAKRPVLLHYVPVRQGGNEPEMLQVTLKSGKEALPVFSSSRAAQNFLLSEAFGREWYARESYAGELVSQLFRFHAEIEWVLLDPLPECLAVEDNPVNLMPWECFVDYLLG